MGASSPANVTKLTSAITGALTGAVRGVVVESQLTGPVAWVPGRAKIETAARGESGNFATWLAGVAKPKITVHTAAGPIMSAPYGQPTKNYRWVVPVVVLGGVFAVGWVAVKLYQSGRR
jgi:hypothetical protein